ncbi:MAG: hypothetical protein JWN70_6845 [Planctomycetaceae bacterium]|nr:hypothetical protein [Planctomycetaceae bacterium]
MKRSLQIAGWLLAVTLLFVLAVFLEIYPRSLAARSIPVEFKTPVRAKVSAGFMPDFLWSGEAWWVEVESNEPVLIDFDGKWSATIPPGDHRVYGNHDNNNTRDFNPVTWHMTPALVTVSKPRS